MGERAKATVVAAVGVGLGAATIAIDQLGRT